MIKTLTFRSIIALFLLAFCLQTGFSQAAFWSETFSSNAAFSAWTAVNAGAGAQNWTRATDPGMNMGFDQPPAAFSAPSAADGFAFFNSDANAANNQHDAMLTSQPINCASHTTVGIRFHSQFADFIATTEPARQVELRVSTDGGTNWAAYPLFKDLPSVDVPDFGLVDADIVNDFVIKEASGQAQVWIQFRWKGTWDFGWKLDDVELYDVPATDVTFKVNASQITVDPAGIKINGSFTNGADADMTDDGNGIWSYKTALNPGTKATWKYVNGATAESVTAACGEPDGAGGFNRVWTVPGSATELTAVCFSSCDPCVVTCDQNPNAIICDNLDSYKTNLKLGPQAPWWTTWSGTEGGNEDGIVTTEQAASAPNSLKIISTATAGGPQDVILDLGSKKTGRYELKWKMYVPTGKRAYFNIQNVVPLVGGAGAWNFDVFFEDNGAGSMNIGATVLPGSFTYPYAKWFEVKFEHDLDNNLQSFWVDGKLAKKMPYPNNLGGIDFFGIDNVHTFYVDDIEYISLPPVVYNVDFCDAAVDLSTYFGGAPGVAQVTGIYNNTNATLSPTDPAANSLCFMDSPDGINAVPKLDGTMWYTFTGDGERYHIETVPCTSGANYIGAAQDDRGDTQMAIYSGACGSLTAVECNEDLFTSGMPDWRAGLDLETVAGENYLMMIDGYNLQGVVAQGEFCISITLAPSVDCSAGKVGTVTLNPYVCFGDNLNTHMTPNVASFVIPTVGPVYGNAWCITNAPVPAGSWPGTIPNIASTPFSPTITSVNLLNDGMPNSFQPGIYYLTPVVVGGGELIDPASPSGARVFNVDPANGCFFVGESKQIILLPDASELDPVEGSITQTGNTINLTPTGGLGALIGDPNLYTYLWSNGATTQDITTNTSGTYSVTITDGSGCGDIDPGVVSYSFVGATDPQSVKSLTLSPNPASTDLVIELKLEKAAELRAEIVNSIGQTIKTLDFGKTASLKQRIGVEGMADGTYFLRISVDGEKALRPFVVSH